MKIAITGPHFWPYLRRGSAAYIYNLSKHLVGLGHEIEVITGKPGKSKVVTYGKITKKFTRYIQHPVLERYHINRIHLFSLNCLYHFIKNDYDIIHCIYHPDGFTLSLLRTLKKIRYVQLVGTTPFRFHYTHSPIDPYMFEKALSRADRCIVPSRYAQENIKMEHNIDCELIPCGVDIQHFRPNGFKDAEPPRIICTAALHDERKNVPLLVKAFELLIQDGTEAILQLVAETTLETNNYLFSLVDDRVRRSIEILPHKTYMQLPELYASAAVSVLSSISETFGMSMLESLACGTPVVGTRSGAIPEIINDPSIGTLFDMVDDPRESTINLYRSIKKALELSKDPNTVERCQKHVSHYEWTKVAKKMESLYECILGVKK
ncbi:MAG: glycosyltransferase family 4 protein [Promethearchaeota archaeon]|jgi:phosphatidylinositol alpha-mannosyltransferase